MSVLTHLILSNFIKEFHILNSVIPPTIFYLSKPVSNIWLTFSSLSFKLLLIWTATEYTLLSFYDSIAWLLSSDFPILPSLQTLFLYLLILPHTPDLHILELIEHSVLMIAALHPLPKRCHESLLFRFFWFNSGDSYSVYLRSVLSKKYFSYPNLSSVFYMQAL